MVSSSKYAKRTSDNSYGVLYFLAAKRYKSPPLLEPFSDGGAYIKLLFGPIDFFKNLLERNLKVLFDVISLSDITKLINELEKDQYQNKYKDYVSKVRILVNEARNKKRKEVANNLQRYKNRYLSRTNGSSSSSLSSFSSSPSSSSSSSTHGGKQRATRKFRKFLRKRKITRKH